MTSDTDAGNPCYVTTCYTVQNLLRYGLINECPYSSEDRVLPSGGKGPGSSPGGGIKIMRCLLGYHFLFAEYCRISGWSQELSRHGTPM
jgi:hypothetical protein